MQDIAPLPLDELAEEINHIATWFTKDDRYHGVMVCGGPEEVIQEMWVDLLKSKPSGKWRVTTVACNQIKWTISRLWNKLDGHDPHKQRLKDTAPIETAAQLTVDVDMLRQLENDEAKVVILNAFRFLPGRLGEVLNMRYGIETGQPMTLREIADHFGITPERIRQLENRALRQMQQHHSYLESHLPCEQS